MTKKLIALSSAALLAIATTAAHATTVYLNDDLTNPVAVGLGGQGFGTTLTVLSIQNNTSPEGGCIAPNGTTGLLSGSSACAPLDGVTGGDEVNPIGNPKQDAPIVGTGTDSQGNPGLGITNGSQVGIIFNGNQPGDGPINITDVSLKLYNSSGALLLVVSDGNEAAFNNLDPFSGQGNSGWLIGLDSTAQTDFNNIIATAGTYYLAVDASYSWASGSGGGAEDIQLAKVTGPVPPATPEPSSLMLLGTGIIGAAGLMRRRMVATNN